MHFLFCIFSNPSFLHTRVHRFSVLDSIFAQAWNAATYPRALSAVRISRTELSRSYKNMSRRNEMEQSVHQWPILLHMRQRSFLNWKIVIGREMNLQRYHTINISLFLKLDDCRIYPEQTFAILCCFCPEIADQLCSACLCMRLDTKHCGGSLLRLLNIEPDYVLLEQAVLPPMHSSKCTLDLPGGRLSS